MSRQTETVDLRDRLTASDALKASPTDPDFDPDVDLYVVTTPQMSTREVFARFWQLTRGDRRWMIVATILLIAAAAADTVAILLFGYVVDHVLTADRGLQAFWRPAAAWAGITTLSTLVSYAGSILSTWVGERFVLRMRTDLHSRVSSAAPDFLDSTRLGDVLTRFTEDLEEVEGLVVSAIIGAAVGIASVVMFSVAAIRLSPTLALLALLLAPLLWGVTSRFSDRVGDVSRAERANHSRMMVVLEEALANTALTRSSGRSGDEARRLAVEGRGWLRLNMRHARLTNSYSAWTGLLEMFAVIGVLGVGAWQISHHTATVGGLLAFSAYLGYLYPPLHSLAGLPLTAAAARASAARIDELEANAAPVPDTGTLTPAGPGALVFTDVSFTYPGRSQAALAHFGLTVAAGEMVALTGPSGAGKSTLAKLLARDRDPSSGTITLDGVDLRAYRLDALRGAMTVLAQETLLFDATLAENIGYARTGATRAQIEAAAHAAGLAEFTTTLPDGLDTRVGQRGRLLSGGQRQRVAIARAFLRDAPLLILDEPTTGLDHDSAVDLVPALRLLAAGRTTLLITHDQGLTHLADRIVSVGVRRPATRGSGFGPIGPRHPVDDELGLPAAVSGRAPRAPRVPEPVPVGTITRPPRRLRRTLSLVGLGGLLLLALGTRILTQQPTVGPVDDSTPGTSATAPPTASDSTDDSADDSTDDSDDSASDPAAAKSATTQHSTTTVLPRTTTPAAKPKPTPARGAGTGTTGTGTTTGSGTGKGTTTGTTTGTGTSTGTGSHPTGSGTAASPAPTPGGTASTPAPGGPAGTTPPTAPAGSGGSGSSAGGARGSDPSSGSTAAGGTHGLRAG